MTPLFCLVFVLISPANQGKQNNPAMVSKSDKVLIFDEDQGIIWVEKGEEKTFRKKSKPKIPTLSQREKYLLQYNHEKMYETGVKFFKDNNFEEALYYFNSLYQKTKNPLALFWSGRCYWNMNDKASAEKRFQSILKKHTQSEVADDACFFLGISQRLKGDYHGADEYFQRLLTDFPATTALSGKLDYVKAASEQVGQMRREISHLLGIIGIDSSLPEEGLAKYQSLINLPPTGKADSITTANLRSQARLLVSNSSQNTKSFVAFLKKPAGMITGFSFMLFIWLLWIWKQITSLTNKAGSSRKKIQTLLQT